MFTLSNISPFFDKGIGIGLVSLLRLKRAYNPLEPVDVVCGTAAVCRVLLQQSSQMVQMSNLSLWISETIDIVMDHIPSGDISHYGFHIVFLICCDLL